MAPTENDPSDIVALIDEAAACSASLAATLVKIGAVMRSSGALDSLGHALQERPEHADVAS